MTTKRPLRTRERVFVLIGIVFILLFTLGGGLSLATEGLEGRSALRDGPVGTLTPTDRKCGDESCRWVGTFTRADGTVMGQDIVLNDSVRVRHTDPMPGAIEGVRLAENAKTAYTADYGWRVPIVKCGVLALVGLAIATGLILMLRSYRTTAKSR
ncbi:hypothetical protein [Kribbella deserti]|uniref:DUF3592 domain-containing protein n=1 Tax=Kribbella deserti TaxID=1926257 RepID=A0ABV6QSG0_9ACTN